MQFIAFTISFLIVSCFLACSFACCLSAASTISSHYFMASSKKSWSWSHAVRSSHKVSFSPRMMLLSQTAVEPHRYCTSSSYLTLSFTLVDIGVLLESHQVKVRQIVVIEDTNSLTYEIFTVLKEKFNVIGLKGAVHITSDFVRTHSL